MCYIPPEIMLCVYFQINTLKENLCKAEAEVCELDKLVDQVREVYKEPEGIAISWVVTDLSCMLQTLIFRSYTATFLM